MAEDGPLNVLVAGLRSDWAFRHLCDRGDRGTYVVAIDLAPGHQVTADGKSVQPSILCGDCGVHGHIIEGEWRPV